MPHLVHHSIGPPPQLLNQLQVICFHHKVLDEGRKTLLHVLIMLNRNSKDGASRRSACANFTWSPILTQAFESRSRGGLWRWENNTDLSWVLNKKYNYELKWSVHLYIKRFYRTFFLSWLKCVTCWACGLSTRQFVSSQLKQSQISDPPGVVNAVWCLTLL